MMRRRAFITLLGGAAAGWPLAARAQRGERMRRISVLMSIGDDAEGRARVGAFRAALHDLGWTHGRNASIDVRLSGGNIEHVRTHVADVVSQKPDAILVQGAMSLAPLAQATRDIPIVFIALSDPVEQGFVESLARPGGNVTGFSIFDVSVVGKLLQVVKEVAPGIARIVHIGSPDNPGVPAYLRSLNSVAAMLGVEPTAAPVRSAADIEHAINEFAREAGGGLLMTPDAIVLRNLDVIVSAAARHRLPAVYPYRLFVERGGLMSYGTDTIEPYRRAASYVDRILKGVKPADLPVQAPTKFELVINLKTAKTLGLTVPLPLLGRADEVIE